VLKNIENLYNLDREKYVTGNKNVFLFQNESVAHLAFNILENEDVREAYCLYGLTGLLMYYRKNNIIINLTK
jgi:hypothetical protein